MTAPFEFEPPPGETFQGFTIRKTHNGNSIVHFADSWGIFVSPAWERHDGGMDLRIETWGEVPYQETFVEKTTTIEEETRQIVGAMIRRWHTKDIGLVA